MKINHGTVNSFYSAKIIAIKGQPIYTDTLFIFTRYTLKNLISKVFPYNSTRVVNVESAYLCPSTVHTDTPQYFGLTRANWGM